MLKIQKINKRLYEIMSELETLDYDIGMALGFDEDNDELWEIDRSIDEAIGSITDATTTIEILIAEHREILKNGEL